MIWAFIRFDRGTPLRYSFRILFEKYSQPPDSPERVVANPELAGNPNKAPRAHRTMRKFLELLCQVGKYTAIAACITATVLIPIRRELFPPFEVSLVCVIGLVIWGFGLIGLLMLKIYNRIHREERKAKKTDR